MMRYELCGWMVYGMPVFEIEQVILQPPAHVMGERVFHCNIRTWLDEMMDHLIWGDWSVAQWIPLVEAPLNPE